MVSDQHSAVSIQPFIFGADHFLAIDCHLEHNLRTENRELVPQFTTSFSCSSTATVNASKGEASIDTGIRCTPVAVGAEQYQRPSSGTKCTKNICPLTSNLNLLSSLWPDCKSPISIWITSPYLVRCKVEEHSLPHPSA